MYGIDVQDWLVLKSGTNVMRDGGLSLSLLDLSIVKGLADCAAACAAMGMRLRDVELCHEATVYGEVHEYRLLELGLSTWEADGFLATGEGCLCAATAAGRAALKVSWRRESAKAIAIYQLLLKLASGRSTEPVVNQVLLFSMEVPEIIDQLGLWDDVAGWQDDLVKPPSAAAGATANEPNAESAAAAELQDVAGASSEVAEPDPSPPVTAAVDEVKTEEMDDWMRAMQHSKEVVPALNSYGVSLFKLTRMATSTFMNNLLFDPQGPLKALHDRVLAAGCQVDPAWSPVKALFVPTTGEQMQELADLAVQGYELSKEDHILALKEDETLLNEALKSCSRCKNRPKAKQVGPQISQAPRSSTDLPQDVNNDMDDDDGPMVVLEGAIRTDSSVGFPAPYPTSALWP